MTKKFIRLSIILVLAIILFIISQFIPNIYEVIIWWVFLALFILYNIFLLTPKDPKTKLGKITTCAYILSIITFIISSVLFIVALFIAIMEGFGNNYLENRNKIYLDNTLDPVRLMDTNYNFTNYNYDTNTLYVTFSGNYNFNHDSINGSNISKLTIDNIEYMKDIYNNYNVDLNGTYSFKMEYTINHAAITEKDYYYFSVKVYDNSNVSISNQFMVLKNENLKKSNILIYKNVDKNLIKKNKGGTYLTITAIFVIGSFIIGPLSKYINSLVNMITEIKNKKNIEENEKTSDN